jgi:hypothetical protein
LAKQIFKNSLVLDALTSDLHRREQSFRVVVQPAGEEAVNGSAAADMAKLTIRLSNIFGSDHFENKPRIARRNL